METKNPHTKLASHQEPDGNKCRSEKSVGEGPGHKKQATKSRLAGGLQPGITGKAGIKPGTAIKCRETTYAGKKIVNLDRPLPAECGDLILIRY